MATSLKACLCLILSLVFAFSSSTALAEAQESSMSLCWKSFDRTRNQVISSSSQSVIIQTDSKGPIPYVTLHDSDLEGNNYTLWQTLNGDIRGYALKGDIGFDYVNTLSQINPLTWHPTLIWNTLFASKKQLDDYSCVLTGRTRVMGKRVSLIRLVPQEGLRYSYLIAKDDETDFPVELTIADARGFIPMRLTVMESRVIMGMDFPVLNSIFENLEQGQDIDSSLLNTIPDLSLSHNTSEFSNSLSQSVADKNTLQDQSSLLEGDEQQNLNQSINSNSLADITKPTPAATMTGGVPQNHLIESNLAKFKPWRELYIPKVFKIIGEGNFSDGGVNCVYQEYSDGLTSFRVYRNDKSTVNFPLLNNATLTIFRKNGAKHEYTVVGEVTVALAEYVLSNIK